MEVAKGDQVNFLEGAGVFFHVDAMLSQEVPDGLFDGMKGFSRSDFKANN